MEKDYKQAGDYAARIYEKYSQEQASAEAQANTESTAQSAPEGTYCGYQSTYEGEMPRSEFGNRAVEKTVSLWDRIKKSPWTKKIAVFLVAALLFGTVAGGAFSVTNHYIKQAYGDNNISIGAVSPVSGSNATSGDTSVAQVVANAMPSVVAITNKGVTELRTFFGTFQQESQSSGSGVIIGQSDNELYIVTNYHVVSGSNQLTVVFDYDGTKADSGEADAVSAVIKGYDQSRDIAVIAVNTDDLSKKTLENIKVATLGSSSDILLGQQVVAIGNALGYGQSVTVGYISALARTRTLSGTDGTTVTGEYLQTDAAINPGNSGGALLNMNGELVGINSGKVESVEAEAMGYAIPIDSAQPIIESILEHAQRSEVAEADRGYLGITGQDVTADAQAAYGMPQGVYISDVTKNAGAEKAGIVKGNIIVAIDGYKVTGMAELQSTLRYYRHGEKITVTVAELGMNGYETKDVEVMLSNAKAAGIQE